MVQEKVTPINLVVTVKMNVHLIHTMLYTMVIFATVVMKLRVQMMKQTILTVTRRAQVMTRKTVVVALLTKFTL